MMTWRCELASKRELVSSIKWLGMMHGTASISTVDGTWKTDHSHKDWAWRVVVSDAEETGQVREDVALNCGEEI